jgi:hypothetical protein
LDGTEWELPMSEVAAVEVRDSFNNDHVEITFETAAGLNLNQRPVFQLFPYAMISQ